MRRRQQAAFAQQRLKLLQHDDERDDVNCRQRALEKQPNQPHMVEICCHSDSNALSILVDAAFAATRRRWCIATLRRLMLLNLLFLKKSNVALILLITKGQSL